MAVVTQLVLWDQSLQKHTEGGVPESFFGENIFLRYLLALINKLTEHLKPLSKETSLLKKYL